LTRGPGTGGIGALGFGSPQFELVQDDVSDDAVVVTVRGEIHVSTAARFSRELAAAIDRGRELVVLDFMDVRFIDSTGLSVLLDGLRRVTRRRGRLVLALSNPTVLRLFEITTLDTTFDIAPTREQALERARA
jgi:anti-sigma B factor antagonist